MIPCTCGCNRQYPRSEIYDLRVKRPVSRQCHAHRLAEPRKPISQPVRELPASVARTLRRWVP